jgi:hypothetical protein
MHVLVGCVFVGLTSAFTGDGYCVVFSLSVQFDTVNDGGGLDAKPW